MATCPYRPVDDRTTSFLSDLVINCLCQPFSVSLGVIELPDTALDNLNQIIFNISFLVALDESSRAELNVFGLESHAHNLHTTDGGDVFIGLARLRDNLVELGFVESA